MSVDTMISSEVALEAIGRNAFVMLYTNINAKIDAQNALWGSLDATYSAETGGRLQAATVDHVDAANMFHGHIPTLLDSPITGYPNLSVFAYQGVPVRNDQDQGDEYDVTMYIEAMVKSQVSLEDVNSKVQRMGQACHAVILGDRSIMGAVALIGDTPKIEVSDAFVRRSNVDGTGDDFFWQGVRLEYVCKKTLWYNN